MTLQEPQYIISLSGTFPWLHRGHMKRLSNDFKLTKTIVPFVFFLRNDVELSTSVTLYLQLSSSVISVVYVVFNIFGLEKGTRGCLSFGNPMPRKLLTHFCQRMLLECSRYYL